MEQSIMLTGFEGCTDAHSCNISSESELQPVSICTNQCNRHYYCYVSVKMPFLFI